MSKQQQHHVSAASSALDTPLVFTTMLEFFCLTLSEVAVAMRIRRKFANFFHGAATTRFCFNLAHRAAATGGGRGGSTVPLPSMGCIASASSALPPLHLMREIQLEGEPWQRHPMLHAAMLAGRVTPVVAAGIAFCRIAGAVKSVRVKFDSETGDGEVVDVSDALDVVDVDSTVPFPLVDVDSSRAPPQQQQQQRRRPFLLYDCDRLKIRFTSRGSTFVFEIPSRPRAIDDNEEEEEELRDDEKTLGAKFKSLWNWDSVAAILREACVFELLPEDQREDEDVAVVDSRIEVSYLRRMHLGRNSASGADTVTQVEVVLVKSADEKQNLNVILPSLRELQSRNSGGAGGTMAVM